MARLWRREDDRVGIEDLAGHYGCRLSASRPAMRSQLGSQNQDLPGRSGVWALGCHRSRAKVASAVAVPCFRLILSVRLYCCEAPVPQPRYLGTMPPKVSVLCAPDSPSANTSVGREKPQKPHRRVPQVRARRGRRVSPPRQLKIRRAGPRPQPREMQGKHLGSHLRRARLLFQRHPRPSEW